MLHYYLNKPKKNDHKQLLREEGKTSIQQLLLTLSQPPAIFSSHFLRLLLIHLLTSVYLPSNTCPSFPYVHKNFLCIHPIASIPVNSLYGVKNHVLLFVLNLAPNSDLTMHLLFHLHLLSPQEFYRALPYHCPIISSTRLTSPRLFNHFSSRN